MPSPKSSREAVRSSNAAATSAYWTMGPAMSWGKQLTYSRSRKKLFWTAVLPRYTSTV